MEVELDLKRAIERDEIVVHYQPIFDLPSGEVAGLEALVRWSHPTRGLILPAEFIPIAEESGQIRALGRWVAARGLPAGRALAGAVPGLRVALRERQRLRRPARASAELDRRGRRGACAPPSSTRRT